MVILSQRRTNKGFTMIEMVIALVLAFLVVLALGQLVVVNQRSWAWGHDKAVLQQNVTEALEWMARSVRAARSVEVISSEEFRTYDESGDLKHTYKRDTVAGEPRLMEDDGHLVERFCTRFEVIANSDTTSLTLVLELEDNAGSLVEGMTRSTLRNITHEF